MSISLDQFDRELTTRWLQIADMDDALLVLQLADSHLVDPAEPQASAWDYPSPAWCLEQLDCVIKEINSLSIRPGCILLSGDMTQHGAAVEWNLLFSRLDKLGNQVVVTLGNHEHRNEQPDSTALADSIASLGSLGAPASQVPGRYACVHRIGSWRLIVLDSADRGDLGESQHAWLAQQLADCQPTIISVHRPVICVDHAVDQLRLVDPMFDEIIADHDHIAAVVCGHAHRRSVQWRGRHPHFIAPAISFANDGHTGYQLLALAGGRCQWCATRFLPGLTVQSFRQPPMLQQENVIWKSMTSDVFARSGRS